MQTEKRMTQTFLASGAYGSTLKDYMKEEIDLAR